MINQPWTNLIQPDAGGNVKPIAQGKVHIGKEGLDPLEGGEKIYYTDNQGVEKEISSPLQLNSTGVFVVSSTDSTIINPYTKSTSYSISVVDKNGKTLYTNKYATGIPTKKWIEKNTFILYKKTSDKTAVENMIDGFPFALGLGENCQCENGTIYKRVGVSSGTIDDFEAITPINALDWIMSPDEDSTKYLIDLWASLKSNDKVDLSGSELTIEVTNNNTTVPNPLNPDDGGVLVLKDKEDIKIYNGNIIFKKGTVLPYAVALFMTENCEGVHVDRIKVDGNFIPTESYVDKSDRGAVFFQNSRRCKLTNSFIEKMDGYCFSISGLGVAPSPIKTNAHDHIIEGNVFRWFQQNSSYGAGACGYIISNNVFINSWGTGYKLSENYTDPSFAGSTHDALITGNVAYWDDDFVAPLTFDGVTRWPQNAVMLQGQSHGVLVSNNLFDTSNIKYDDNETCPIQCYSRSSSTEDLFFDRVSIKANTLISKRYGLRSGVNAAVNFDITHNTFHCPFIGLFGTGEQFPSRFGKFTFAYNTWALIDNTSLKPTFISQKSKYEYYEFIHNDCPESTTISFENVDVNNLNIKHNTGKLDIDVAGAITRFDVSYNEIESIDWNGALNQMNIDYNQCVTDEVPVTLTFTTGVERSSICHNSVHGLTQPNAGGFVVWNQSSGVGNVVFDKNSTRCETAKRNQFTGSVNIMSGELEGLDSTPEGVYTAFIGTTYKGLDKEGQIDRYYYKTTTSGNTGWAQINMTK